MKRVLWAGAAALALLISGLGIFHPNNHRADLASSLVLLQDAAGICSGVHIAGGTFLTANHCIDGEEIAVETSTGEKAAAQVVAIYKALDVALITALPLANGTRSAKVSCMPFTVGEPIEIAGHPLGVLWMHTYGRVANVNPLKVNGVETWKSVVALDVTGGPGSSGGPVYDIHGRVRGLVVGGYQVPIPMGSFLYAVPASAFCGLLNAV